MKPGVPESGCPGLNLALPRKAVQPLFVASVCSAARQGRQGVYQGLLYKILVRVQ